MKFGRTSKKKRSKNNQHIMKSAPNSFKNRPGDPPEALWRRLGCPRGPRGDFGSEKLFLWTPPHALSTRYLRYFRRVGPSCKKQTKKTDMRSNRYLRRFSHFGKETAGSLDPPWTLSEGSFLVFLFDVKTVCFFN